MKTYSDYLEKIGEYGVVKQINHPLVTIEGLPHVGPHEIVFFENGTMGEVFSINNTTATVLTFSKIPVTIGTQVVRTGKQLSIPVSMHLLGQTIDPLGNRLDGIPLADIGEERLIHATPLGIAKRSRIKKPLRTGISIVDLLVPIGKGQRELIIGDRKTGKTSFLLDTLTKQISEGTVVIYAAIGKKKSEIKLLQEYFIKNNLQNKVVLVATSSYDPATLIYLTPYTAMTIAEYFRDDTIDSLIILDDLSTHAKCYRELSLLAKKFPGRDSYPGDIFHAHAKLLERAGNFASEKGDVSITCLPVVETVEGDFTGYIPTNIMSMTDGHIFFDTNILFQGRRPAVNSTLSVTRVGKQVHTVLERSINRELLALLTLYEKAQNLSHFGAELSESMKQIVASGEKFNAFFDQPPGLLLPIEVQIILLAMLWQNLVDFSTIVKSRVEIIKKLQTEENKKLVTTLMEAKTYNDLLANIQNQKDRLLQLCV